MCHSQRAKIETSEKIKQKRRWNLPFCGWLPGEVIPIPVTFILTGRPVSGWARNALFQHRCIKKNWRMLCPENSGKMCFTSWIHPAKLWCVPQKHPKKTDLPRRFPTWCATSLVPWRFSVATVCAPSGRSRVARRVQSYGIFHGILSIKPLDFQWFSWDFTITNMRIFSPMIGFRENDESSSRSDGVIWKNPCFVHPNF